jgi:membrane fusion protein, copper/silver efflux system
MQVGKRPALNARQQQRALAMTQLLTVAPPVEEGTEHSAPEEILSEGAEKAPPGVRAMAMVRWALVAAMALAAAGSMLYYFDKLPSALSEAGVRRYHCPMHPSIVKDQPGDCPICGMSLVLVEESGAPGGAAPRASSPTAPRTDDTAPYACPMHPGETSSDPAARCPICKMKLEPRKVAPGTERPAGPSHEAPAPVPGVTAVDLPEGRIQLIGMKTARVGREALTPEIRTVGYVAVNERGQATIGTRFAGWIEKLHVNQTGERVSRGQVVATIFSPQLLAAQQDFLNSRRSAGAGGDPGLGEAARQRLELLGLAGKELAEIARTGEPLRAVPLRSPVSGHVIVKNALPGVYVQPGASLFEVADLGTVWVLAEVYEYEAGRVRVGQEARFELAAYPGEAFAGRVRFIYPSLDPSTRALRLRLELKNPGFRLKPGMYGNVTLELARSEGLVVPRDAVIDTGEVQYAFVARPGGRFEPRRLKIGARAEGKLEVLSGLSEGETVVTTGNFLVDSESRLRSAIEGVGTSAPGGSGAAPPAGDHAGHGP